MEVQTEEKKLLQWHPAFYAGIQIELKDEAKHLIFENEHQLEEKEAEKLIEEYKNYKDNPLYQSMMDVIVRANEREFQEVDNMCDALMELMKDKLDAKKAEGEIRVNALYTKLMDAGRKDDVFRAIEDKEYQHKLFEEFGL